MEKDYAVEYVTLKKYMDALKDELSSSCGNSEEIFNCIAEKYKNNGKTHVVLDPSNDKRKIKEILESLDNDVRKGMLCEDIKEFTEAFYDELAFIYGEKNATYLAEEAKRLVDSYDNCYDEDDYVCVHPDVLLARRNRIVSEFDILTSSEIENEYLLMYNAYTSEIRCCDLFDKMLCSLSNEDDVSRAMLASSANFVEKMKQDGTLHLTEWTPQAVYIRKEIFLDLISHMDCEDAMECYKEICDVWLSRTQFNEMFRQECINAVGQDIVAEADRRVKEQIAKDAVTKDIADMSDEEIEASLTSEEKDTLNDLFDVQ